MKQLYYFTLRLITNEIFFVKNISFDFWNEIKKHCIPKNNFVTKSQKCMLQVGETYPCLEQIFNYLKKFLCCDGKISTNFELSVLDFLFFEGEKLYVKIPFLMRKNTRHHSCQNTHVIWQKRNFKLEDFK